MRGIFSQKSENFTYTLPDGKKIVLDDEIIKCPEALFNISQYDSTMKKVDRDSPTFPQLVHSAITKCPAEQRKRLFSNVKVSGGTSMFRGVPERLCIELQNFATLSKNKFKFRVAAPPDRSFSVWQGGAILASLTTFDLMWVTREDYEESGPRIVHKKCSF